MFQIAVLGAGRIGRIHAKNVAAHPNLRLKAIVDPDATGAGQLAQETGAEVSSLDAVLADSSIAGVIVASPTDQHLPQTLKAIAAGKAVMC